MLALVAATAAAIPPVVALLLWSRCGWHGCPDVRRLAAHWPGGGPVLLDRYGATIGELELGEQVFVALDELPSYVPEAFIATEDRRFRSHRGVDWVRVGGAALANLRAGGLRQGSSTITMQLARTVFPERVSRTRKTITRKLVEARVAQRIESTYGKDQILELYLNEVYFGDGKRGIAAAAEHYFRKPASELELSEAALLAALPKAPASYDPRDHPERARTRRDLVLRLMAEQGRVSATAAAAAQQTELGVPRRGRDLLAEEPFAAYFVARVRAALEERFGDDLYAERVRVLTTLDARAQRAAEEELEAQLVAIERDAYGRFSGLPYSPRLAVDGDATPYLQGALVLREANTGDVLAWIGGRDWHHSRYERVAHARRSPGSAFKPFVYAAAIESGVPMTQTFSDLPLTVELAGGRRWQPRNYEGDYASAVTLRDALVQSRNLATVRVAQDVGLDRVAAVASAAGLPAISPVPAAALGVDPVSPLDLASAYGTFATLGRRVAPRLVLQVQSASGEVLWEAPEPEVEDAIDPAVAYVVTNLLHDAVARGTGRPARLAGARIPIAGKTGTTNDSHDAWFVGYTPDVVGAVWVGFDRPRQVVSRASGGRLAAPVFGRLLRQLYEHRPHPGGWPAPEGVVLAPVDVATGQVIASGCSAPSGRTYTEVFLADHMPAAVCPDRPPRVWARFFGWLPQGTQPPVAGPREEVVLIPDEEIGPDGELTPRARERLGRAERRLRERLAGEQQHGRRGHDRGHRGHGRGHGRGGGRGPR